MSRNRLGSAVRAWRQRPGFQIGGLSRDRVPSTADVWAFWRLLCHCVCCAGRVSSGGCSPRMAKVSVESRPICLLVSGSDCRVFSTSGLGADIAERETRRFATANRPRTKRISQWTPQAKRRLSISTSIDGKRRLLDIIPYDIIWLAI
jgi:hypothetical protein